MKLLLVFPFTPYPPDDGGRIGFFNPIKYLSRQHEVAILYLAVGTEAAAVEKLRDFCPDVFVYHRAEGSDWLRLIRGTASFPPGTAAKYWSVSAGDFIGRTIRAFKPDLVEFHHLNTAIYQRYAAGVPAILREHNVEHKVWERYSQTTSGLLERAYASWTAPRVRRYEAECVSRFERCIAVSTADAAYLQHLCPRARVEVIPSGVDTEYFFPCSDTLEQSCRMVLTGSFEWKPKQHNLRVLLTDIMPRIRARVPQATLYVVGKGVPADLVKLAGTTPGVTVAGAVMDVRPYVSQSSLVLNYLESGGGIALKVLEAMALRKPVLSNSLGCEGIRVQHGHDVYLADGVEAFAKAASMLLKDPVMCKTLATNGYDTVSAYYSWNVIAQQLTHCYHDVVTENVRTKELKGSLPHIAMAAPVRD
jgi:glycosyltransferase involved in cell wall biosynthesis